MLIFLTGVLLVAWVCSCPFPVLGLHVITDDRD